jgi:hypothetical protein
MGIVLHDSLEFGETKDRTQSKININNLPSVRVTRSFSTASTKAHHWKALVLPHNLSLYDPSQYHPSNSKRLFSRGLPVKILYSLLVSLP